MPAKEEITLTPNKLGLTQKELIYLFVYKKLNEESSHPAALFKIMEDTVNPELMRSRAHFYKTIEEMEGKGWITHVLMGNKKVYSLTASGKEMMDWYENIHYPSLSSVREIASHLIAKITGSGTEPVPVGAREYTRLFNRLINVRELVIYLFLEALYKQRELTAKEVYDYIREEYGWSCSEGYLYELAHELEGDPKKSTLETPWIKGEWEGRRRTSYKYRLTEEGSNMRHQAGETALYYIRRIYQYVDDIMYLLQYQKDKGIGMW